MCVFVLQREFSVLFQRQGFVWEPAGGWGDRGAKRSGEARRMSDSPTSGMGVGAGGRPWVSTTPLTASAKRLLKELADISVELPSNCTAGPKGDNLYEWTSTIMGPSGASLHPLLFRSEFC